MKKIQILTLLFVVVSYGQIRLVKDVNYNTVTSASNSNIQNFHVFNNKLFFSARSNSTTLEQEPWVSDGTTAGTVLLKNLNSIYSSSPDRWIEYNGLLYFSAFNDYSGKDIYVTDGTEAGTNLAVNVIAQDNEYSKCFFDPPFIFDNKIYFVPYVPNLSGQEFVENGQLMFTDGTQAGTQLLVDLNSSRIFPYLEYNNYLYFVTDDNIHGNEIWRTDGTATGTTLFKDLIPGADSSSPTILGVVNDDLIISYFNPTYGNELFLINTITGTETLLKNINTTSYRHSHVYSMTKIGNWFYFMATDTINATKFELWRTDGTTANTYKIKDINPSPDIAGRPEEFTEYNGIVYFSAKDQYGRELWRTDGTTSGTYKVKQIRQYGSQPKSLVVCAGKLYFTALNTSSNRSLWSSDGTEAGTVEEANLDISGDLAVMNDELYFTANDDSGIGRELWAFRNPALSTNNFGPNENAILLYPNPSKEFFQLDTNLIIEKVEMYSLQGQLVKTFEAQSQYNISNVAKGMYLVKITTEKGLQNKTIIIE